MRWRARLVDFAFDLLEGVVSLYDFVRGMRKVDPIPLTRRATIRPPPP